MSQDKDLRGNSKNWANRMSELSPTTCKPCEDKHGTIVKIAFLGNREIIRVNDHPHDKCIYVAMRTKKVETATDDGQEGVDAYLFYLHRLPLDYVDKNTAYRAGWKSKYKSLSDALPGKKIGGDIYQNREGKLPDKRGRIWHEADINYAEGKRNTHRILYSNDNLIFVTYDHYETFYEITQ